MAIYKYNHPMRKSPRASVAQFARIVGDDGKPLGSCTMIDVSVNGAQLQFKTPLDVPESFVLVLSNDSRVKRQCKLVWRGPKGVGVQFLKPIVELSR